MQALIRPARQDDEPFLWQMLFLAAHLPDESAASVEAAKSHPELRGHVQGWGQRATDLGVLALHPHDQRPLGAAWIRVPHSPQPLPSLIAAGTPELVIAVLPAAQGQGVGTQLLTYVLEAASQLYPDVMLTVRTSNPARVLYERMGFKCVGTVRNRVGGESLLMVRRFEKHVTGVQPPQATRRTGG